MDMKFVILFLAIQVLVVLGKPASHDEGKGLLTDNSNEKSLPFLSQTVRHFYTRFLALPEPIFVSLEGPTVLLPFFTPWRGRLAGRKECTFNRKRCCLCQ